MEEFPRIVAVDANFLICLCEKAGDRWEKSMYLLERLDKVKGKLIIPTPALAEFLVFADDAAIAIMDTLAKRSSVEVSSFDTAAAFEAANMDAAAIGRKNKRDGRQEPWQKIKVDRQNVAVARAKGAAMIISDDKGVRDAATRVGIRSSDIDDLALPDHARQAKLPIAEPSPLEDDDVE